MGKGPVCNIEDSPFYVFRACARGLADTVEKLIEEDRGRATGKDTKGWTCMHHAASRDKVIIMDLVMKFSNATLNAVNSDGNTPLHLAAEGNRKNAVRHLLILGADPNILNHKAMAPLHLATNNSHHLVIKELLANPKVDVNLKSKNGSTAVHLAAVLNHKETTTALVEGAANLCQPNSHGFYPIHLAAKHASNDALEIILRAAEDGGVSREKMFSFLDAENNSPLHSAVNGGDSEAVRMCVLNGAKVDARSDDDATPFHLACNQGSLDIVRLMLDIFEKDHGDITELLEAEDINGLTPLHRAAVYDHPEVVRFLISKEANYEAKDVDGRTPLLLCAAKGGAASLRALMEAGASVSVRDTSSKNVLHFLVAHGERMTPELELIYSSPRGRQLLDQQDVAGCTPLHLATRSGNLAFLDSLLSLGAKVATKDNADQSVLHFAARYGRTNTVRKLLEHSGRIMNETDGVGMTPLHVASACGHAKVVSLLLQRGALIHKDFTGQSPLHLAAERGHTQAMKLLLSFHRNLLDVGDKRGNSALHLAAMADEAASVELLLSWEAKFTPNVEHKTPLDLAIEHLCEDAALVMVNDHRWKEFLSVTSEQYGSPLLGLIQYLPNVQKAVLDRCRTPSKAHAASRHYWEKYDFSLMEAPMGTAAKLAQQLSDNGEGRVRIKQALLCANTMVRFGRVNLLSHPVCLAYLNMKWRAYGSSVFYVNLLLYLGFLSCMTWLMTAMVIDGSVSPHLDHDYPHRQVLVSPLNYTFKVRLGFLSCMTWLMTAMVIDGSVSPHLDHDYPHRQVLVSPLNYTFKVRLGFLSCMTWLMTAMVIDGSVSPHLDHDYPHRQVLVSPLNYTFKVRLGFLSCMTWLMTAMVIDGSVSPHLDHDYPHRQVLVSPLNYTFKVRLGFLSCMTWLMTAMVIDGSVSPHLDHDYPHRQVLVSPLNYTFKPHLSYYQECMEWEKRGAVVFIVAFLILNYAKEFLQIYQQKIMYFLDLVNVIEWSLYVSAMIFVGPLLFEGGMREFQWQFGTVALFLSWFNVLMHLQRTESMGLYVVMFLHIFRTVMKVITIFSVLFIGFGLAFHILFTNDPARGWDGPVTSIVQSVMMMMGEWYFLHNYVDPREGEAPYALPFPRLSMLFLLAFVLLMPILFINLLIGLAVGDIEMVQKDARLKRLAMQVEYHTELEDRLPKFLKKRIMRSESIIYPNRISSTDLLASVVRWIHLISGRQEEVRIRDTSMVSLQERRTLEILANMAQLHKRIQQVELEHAMRLEKQMDMLRLLAQKMEIHSEADVFDEGDVFHSGPNSRASNDNLPISEDLISIAELALPEVSPPSRRGGGVFHSGPNSRASNDNLPISEDLISIAELALPEVSPPSRRGGGVFHSGPNSRASNDNLPISEDLISIAELALPEVSPPSRRGGGGVPLGAQLPGVQRQPAHLRRPHLYRRASTTGGKSAQPTWRGGVPLGAQLPGVQRQPAHLRRPHLYRRASTTGGQSAQPTWRVGGFKGGEPLGAHRRRSDDTEALPVFELPGLEGSGESLANKMLEALGSIPRRLGTMMPSPRLAFRPPRTKDTETPDSLRKLAFM